MKNCDKQNLIISIESSIDFIESHLDSADKTIAFVFKKHSVRNLEKSSIHMKNRAKRKRNFPHRQWRKNWYGNYQLTYQGRKVFINNKGGNRYSVYVDGKTSWSYEGKPLDNFVSAAYAAFEAAWENKRKMPKHTEQRHQHMREVMIQRWREKRGESNDDTGNDKPVHGNADQ